MKKLLIVLIILLVGLVSYSQTYHYNIEALLLEDYERTGNVYDVTGVLTFNSDAKIFTVSTNIDVSSYSIQSVEGSEPGVNAGSSINKMVLYDQKEKTYIQAKVVWDENDQMTALMLYKSNSRSFCFILSER